MPTNWLKGFSFKNVLGGFVAKSFKMPFVSSMASRYQLVSDMLMSRNYLGEYKNWVFACVQARSEEVGNIKLKLLKGGEEVDEHPLLDLLNKVNPSMTRSQLFSATQSFKDLDGNSYWFLARDRDGKGEIKEIYPLRPDKVQIVPSKENPLQVEGYIFTQPDGQKIPFKAIEILHHKNFNPLGNHPFPHKGMGIVEAAAWSIDTDNQARLWNFNFFKNSARPDGVLTTAGESSMGAEELQRLQEEWGARHGTAENAHKVAILSGGMSWTEISRSQKDMDFAAQRIMNRDEILALFRTPKSILGITDDVNRANADATIYVFALRTVKPLMQQIVDTLNEMLVPEFGDDLELAFESPVTEDRKQSLDEYASGIANGWLSVNEVREQEGLEPVEGGDTLFLPLQMAPIGTVTGADGKKKVRTPLTKRKAKAKKTAKVAPTAEKTTAEAAIDKLLESRKHKTTLPQAQKTEARELTPEAKAKYIELYKAQLHISREPLEKKIREFFKKQEKEVKRNAREQMKFYTAEQMKGLMQFLFDEEDAVQASISLITPFIREYIKASGNHAGNLVGLTSFDAGTEALNNFIEARAKYFAKTINDTTRESLLISIKEGLDAGETLKDIETRIAGVYDIATGSRTQMIARTEISAASNQGAKQAYKQGGVDSWQWVVVSPEDNDCLENDGAVVKIGEPFPDGDVEPPVHPNCECTTVPVFKHYGADEDEE